MATQTLPHPQLCQRSAALQLHKGEPTTPSKMQLGLPFTCLCHSSPWGNTRLGCATLRAPLLDLISVCCSVPSIPFEHLCTICPCGTGKGDCACRCPVLWRHENTGKSPLPFRCQDVEKTNASKEKAKNTMLLTYEISKYFETANE